MRYRAAGRARPALAALLAAGALALASCGGQTAAQPTQTTMEVREGPITQSISGSGTIQARRESFLNFSAAGVVARVQVEEGQAVKAGEVLALLDTSDLDQQVKQAEANLASALAALADLQDGPAETDLRTAQSKLEASQLQLSQTASGTARPSEIASARAQLASAQAALDALRNPTAADRSAAERAVQDAQIQLEATRNSASAAKTNADLALQQAVSSLTQAQSNYATAKKDWDFVQETGRNPSNPETTGANGSREANRVSDTQRQQYYDSFVQAEAALRSAEASVTKSQVAYDSARQQEVTDVQQAESQLSDAQAQLAALLNPSQANLASAQSSVTQAQANLDKLIAGGSQSEVAIAQTSVDQAQASLEALAAPPTEAALAAEQAKVAQAEAALAEAQRNRADAQLVAPFDGTVAAVNISVGETSGGSGSADSGDASTAAVYLIDTGSFYVDTNISEVDLQALKVGQSARVTVDALAGTVITGTLSYIALTPTVENNVTTYAARVSLDKAGAQLRIGLSAAVTIVTAQVESAVLVPNIAIQETPRGKLVVVRRGDEDVPTEIETGVVGDSRTQVLSGLKAGDLVVVTVQSDSGTNTTVRIPGGGGFPGAVPAAPGGRPGQN